MRSRFVKACVSKDFSQQPPSGGFLRLKESEMNIEQYLDDLIEREGGYVNNPADRGGQLNTELLKQYHVQTAIKAI